LKRKILCIPTARHLRYVFSDETLERLKTLFDVTFNPLIRDYTSEELAARIRGFEGLITGWGSPPLTEEVFENADKLRIIVHSAGSVKASLLSKRVVEKYIIPRGICVCNAPKAIAYNVAETTMGLMIMAGHRLLDHILNVRERMIWRDPSISREGKTLNGSTIGIVGASTVGREVIRLLKPFDCRILVYDPYLPDGEAERLGVEKVSLEGLFEASDFVSVHAPLTEETVHMIGRRHFKLMKDGAVFINTSRGRVIDQEALMEECKTGRFFAVLDVTDPEPLPVDSPLRRMRNVIITPHVAGNGYYGAKKIGEMTLQALVDFFSGREVKNRVDMSKYDILA
jgi:phosphoglycerate dehydrogenase-like enzyme